MWYQLVELLIEHDLSLEVLLSNAHDEALLLRWAIGVLSDADLLELLGA